MYKMKTLYKLARSKMFYNNYNCPYCGMMDFDKEYMNGHVKFYHDEIGRSRKMFTCRKCLKTMNENKILAHEC